MKTQTLNYLEENLKIVKYVINYLHLRLLYLFTHILYLYTHYWLDFNRRN